MTEQVSKSDAHIKSLEDLVSSLKMQANGASAESTAKPAVEAASEPITEAAQPEVDVIAEVENS